MYLKLQHDDIHLALVKDDHGWKHGKRLIDDDYYLINSQLIDMMLLPHWLQIRISLSGHITKLIERWWNLTICCLPTWR